MRLNVLLRSNTFIASTLTFLTIIICFIWSKSNGNVTVAVPFISQTGAFSPEYYFFAIGLTISGVLFIFNTIIVYISLYNLIHYEYETLFKTQKETSTKHLLNTISLITGILSAIGVCGLSILSIENYKIAHQVFSWIYIGGACISIVFLAAATWNMGGHKWLFFPFKTTTDLIVTTVRIIALLALFGGAIACILFF